MTEEVANSGVAAEELKSFIERCERIQEEIAAGQEDFKEIMSEAKSRGFDTKILRMILRLRKQDFAERQEQEAILELYMQAIGMAA
jgi:uncharacterized protein (UPF0335 family)